MRTWKQVYFHRAAIMLKIVRESKWFFIAATLAAIVLRLVFIFRFPSVTTDSFIYGDIAKNWLQHGVYGLSSAGEVVPTYIRLPGYPAFLAAIFAIFGVDHYRAVLIVQMFVDLGTCFLIANLARRLTSESDSKAAFLLAALCPFLANYAAAALTESLEIFFTTLALNFAVAGLKLSDSRKLGAWIGCGLATAAAMLLRPDGGILLISIELFLAWQIFQTLREKRRAVALLRAAVVVGLFSVAPLIPWTLRNLHTMHRFQPLAPRYANEEDEFVPTGFNYWIKTWIIDYASVEEVYWQVPGQQVDPEKLPHRAFDSPLQRQATLQTIEDYNSALHVSPELDAEFRKLAYDRVRHSSFRYYLWLPALRIVDMWLRPRTEMLPADTRWWEFNDEPKWSVLAVGLGILGIFYVAAALVGLIRGKFKHLGLLLTFVVVRSLFLGTLENPEPRYVLECYPVVILLAAAAFQRNLCTRVDLRRKLAKRRIGHAEPGSHVL
jgi:4-amino-4-deoxy-L-arabinose transferase-like glycosyltransferase